MPRYYQLPQLDGPSETRKAKKRDKLRKKKSNNSKGKASASASSVLPVVKGMNEDSDARKEGGGHPQGGLGSNLTKGDVQTGVTCPAAVAVDGHPVIVDGSRSLSIPHGGEPTLHDDGQLSLTSSEETIRLMGEEEQVNQDSHHCQVHRKALCQFNPACCVHKCVAECRCPPNRTCCCLHHSGDCCHCIYDSKSARGNQDKTAMITATAAAVSFSSSSWSIPPPPDAPPSIITSTSTNEPGDLPTADYLNTVTLDDNVAYYSVTDYLRKRLEKSELCDCQITLHSSQGLFWPVTFRCHKIILSRSPLFHSKFVSEPNAQKLVEVTAVAGDHFSMIHSFDTALQNLYGRPLLCASELKSITLSSLGYEETMTSNLDREGPTRLYPFSVEAAMADLALCYASCGAFFRTPSLIERGFQLAVDLLSWETVETILNYSLSIGRFSVVMGPINFPGSSTDVHTDTHAHPHVDSGATTGPGGIDTTVPSIRPARMPSLEPLQLHWSPHLMTACLDFVINRITPKFELYRAAQGTGFQDRIPESLRTPFPLPVPSTPIASPQPIPIQSTTTSTTTTTSAATIPTTAAADRTKKTRASNSIFVEKNPLLTGVKFGSLPTEASSANNPQEKQHHAAIANPVHEHKHEPEQKQRQREQAQQQQEEGEGESKRTDEPKPKISNPGLDITVPSAIFICLPFTQLQLAFAMMTSRKLLSHNLAQAVIMEREARRMRALRVWKQRQENMNVKMAVVHTSDTSHHHHNKNTTPLEMKRDGGSENEAKAGIVVIEEKGDGEVKGGGDEENNIPDEVNDLGFREFLCSKVGVEGKMEITLEREWAGFD